MISTTDARKTAGDGPVEISVIVPFRDNLDQLALCLQALERQTVLAERNLEIVAVNNGTEIPSPSMKNQFPHVVWVNEQAPGSYAARNRGLRCASGSLLAFTDADCIPEPDWLAIAVRTLEVVGPQAIVAGQIKLIDPVGRGLNACEVFDEKMLGLAKQRQFVERGGAAQTANVIASRLVFDAAGSFDGALRSSGDVEWVRRAVRSGASLHYLHDAVVRHPRRSTFAEIAEKSRRVVGGQIILRRKQATHWSAIGWNVFWASPLNPLVWIYCLVQHSSKATLVTNMKLKAVMLCMSFITMIEKCRVIYGRTPQR